jgi:mannose-6-phosphate isomerase-like protein (cupin superfamily)
MRGSVAMAIGLMMAMGGVGVAQATVNAVPVPPAVKPAEGVDYRSDASLEELAKGLMAASKVAASGNVSVTLDKYPGYFTMLSTRVKSGGAELHAKAADLFVAIDGEATVITGGTIVDRTDKGDEARGTRVDGGVAQVMHKGDVITIAPNVPHQTLVAPGKTFTYFVVKVVPATGS